MKGRGRLRVFASSGHGRRRDVRPRPSQRSSATTTNGAHREGAAEEAARPAELVDSAEQRPLYQYLMRQGFYARRRRRSRYASSRDIDERDLNAYNETISMTSARHPQQLPRVLQASGPHHRAELVARPRRRSDAALHQRRHEPVQGRVPRAREARLHARDDVAEVHAGQRQAQRPRNVGPSLRHHTFFEMLGNFSFGDYFKKEAIPFAWELLTTTWKLSPDRLYPTIFNGERDIPRDAEAHAIWRSSCPPDRITELGMADNFWAMGETGPCGRCSEIHYFRGEHVPCDEERGAASACGIDCNCDRFVEIWNNVFMEFDRQPDGALKPLPAPSIDTGMGLERVTAVIQGKLANYDTDLFTPILSAHRRACRPRVTARRSTIRPTCRCV